MGAAHGIEGSFVVVHEFMAKGLGLKGNDLIVYARIFGFANAGKPYFESKAGSAGFCGISKQEAPAAPAPGNGRLIVRATFSA